MAKESMKARERKRAKMVEKFAAKRAALKKAGEWDKLQQLPVNGSKVRMHNRCGHMRDPGAPLRGLITSHLNPHEPGPQERNALWTALMHNDALRGEYALHLTSQPGQQAWLASGGSEAAYQAWVAPQTSMPMQKCRFRRMLLIFKGVFEPHRRAWIYSWTQKPSVSFGSGDWSSLDTSRAPVTGAMCERTT